MPMLPALRRMLMPWKKASMVPSYGGGWYPIIREANTGFWQRNIEVNNAFASSFHADFACRTLIARDIAKMGVRLMERQGNSDIWRETQNAAFSPVLREPNEFQTSNQFWEYWLLSKLSRGNTYALKVRDARRVVTALLILDPARVWPLVADDGSVFYRLAMDQLNGLGSEVTVPASEIIHDRMNAIHHPLVGIPPIYASGLAATQGLNIQTQSVRLFANNSRPGGLLTAPGKIGDDTAARLKEQWEATYGGANTGRVAVVGDGLKYEPMTMTAEAAQLIEQLEMTAAIVCSTYHVPPFKIGVGEMPAYDNVQALGMVYYQQCLQSLIEDAEACLDRGLGLGKQFGLRTEFDTSKLLRMDATAQATAVTQLVAGSILTPNEGRARFNEPPLEGGDTVYMQQQNYSLEALAKRDAREDPFAAPKAEAPAEPPADDEGEDAPDPEAMKALAGWHLQKHLDALAA